MSVKSNKTLLNHIPDFLDYCKKIGLSKHTQENYKRYLEKFILWLKKEKKENTLPHELNITDISKYKLFLSNKDNKGKTLKPISQNYYLIVLRALLSYFTAKDIDSLVSAKISLIKGFKREKTVILTLKQTEKLLEAPDIQNPIGLRDKVILTILVSTGLKINKLIKLNKDDYDLPYVVLPLIKKYLQTRKDNNRALFINYRSKKNADRRLTSRSIERIVNEYGKKINLPFLITPEILRWGRAFTLSNEKIEIIESHSHKIYVIKNYKIKNQLLTPSTNSNLIKKSPSSWYVIENIINQEENWLKNNIPVLPEGYKNNPSFLQCDKCILRKIAILIASGKINAVEYQTKNNDNLWNNLTKIKNLKSRKLIRHGKEWHKKMMNVINEYFELQNYKVIIEPTLNYGRADLGIYLDSNTFLFVEIDTVSLFKLWYNLSTMKNVTFLIIPSEDKIIEFQT